MRLIEDGNLKEWVRVVLVIVGIGMVVGSALLGLHVVVYKSIFILGVVIAALGGYASQAHMFKIKPFDTRYKKARNSYKTKENDEDQLK
ncbi:hypothetical protein [Burkholderia ambifaria]|uniref:hypothetical protein n=1 Tax=Burkholderia ambifaria TaxID=152480 RepID=UPI00158ECF3F|nr:hypothetical protein [Burkholderia ambifaria]WDR86093.1 hypothetical protein OR986_06665 [Burkholderia ambifaria]WDR98725.1 hypothetical protein OR985_11625 [Burkholderia ambifaria]